MPLTFFNLLFLQTNVKLSSDAFQYPFNIWFEKSLHLQLCYLF